MQKVTVEEMEIGNLLFERSRREYSVPRTDDYERPFQEFLERSGFDGYGHVKNEKLNPYWNDELFCFENDTFVLRPYYWGDKEEIEELPNFVYKPNNIEMTWYKYPLRSAYINRDIDEIEFQNMLAECEKSLDSVYGGKIRFVERQETMEEYMSGMRELETALEDAEVYKPEGD